MMLMLPFIQILYFITDRAKIPPACGICVTTAIPVMIQ